MRELLTAALAEANPRAYAAHFRRLDAAGQQAYLQGLAPARLRGHFRALGEVPAVGLLLSVRGGVARLEATVGGCPLGSAEGPALAGLQARALELGRAVEARAVSGLASGSLVELAALEAALAELGWRPRSVLLAGDGGGGGCAPTLGWSMRGTIGEAGAFYTPNEALRWDERAQVEALLQGLAARSGAVLDLRWG